MVRANDFAQLSQALEADRPVVVHIHTVKGKGFAPAEEGGLEGMEKWHAAKPGSIVNGKEAPSTLSAATKTAAGSTAGATAAVPVPLIGRRRTTITRRKVLEKFDARPPARRSTAAVRALSG